jgi:hypothetical protein
MSEVVMNREDIVRMAQECGYWSGETVEMNDVGLERFASLVAAAEREACAQIAHDTYEGFGVDAKGVDFVKQHIAIRIRERGAP